MTNHIKQKQQNIKQHQNTITEYTYLTQYTHTTKNANKHNTTNKKQEQIIQIHSHIKHSKTHTSTQNKKTH